MHQLVPFADFLDRTRAARFEDHERELVAAARRFGLQVDARAEFQKMKDYILRTIYKDVHPVSSHLDGAGHPIDCIPFEQQPGVRAAALAGHVIQRTPPPPLMPDPAAEASPPTTAPPPSTIPPPPESPKHQDEGRPREAPAPPCPEGTIPMRRITLEEVVRSGSLEHYLQGHHLFKR